MPGARKNFFGLEGFVWFIGIVEDRNDPEKMGRVRVRCFGWHTDNKELIPTEVLPWAHPMMPATSPVAYAPKEGEMVLGFFMDGDSAQNPVLLGVLPGKPAGKPDYEKGFSDPRTDFSTTPTDEAYPLDSYLNEPSTSRLSRGRIDSTIIEKRKRSLKTGVSIAGGGSWSEPTPSYAAKYPYNYAHESESGHVFELDDTPDVERVHLAHKIGSFIEMDYNGDRIEKIKKDNYSIIMGNDFVSISGACNITVSGDCKLKVGGEFRVDAKDITMVASGDINIKGGDVKIQSTSDINLRASDDFNAGGSGKTSIIGGKSVTVGGSTFYVAAAKVELQAGSPTVPSSASVSGSGSSDTSSNTTTSNTTTSNTTTSNTTTSNTTTSNTNSTTTEEPSLTSKLLTGATTIAGKVSTEISSIFTNVTAAIGGNLSPDEFLTEMQTFESDLNSISGRLQDLLPEELGVIKDLVVEIAAEAEYRGVDLSLVDSVLYVAEAGTQTAKQLYPQTEVAVTSNNSTGGG